MKKTVTKKEAQDRLRRNEKKWTSALMEAGWTVIPSVILERQQALGFDPVDINILLQLARYWWYEDNPPHPSKKAIAECIGRSESTVRRRIAGMEAGGLIKRKYRFDKKYGQRSNEYLFNGLIKEATPYAEELLKEREDRKKEDVSRRKRKRPKLRVVKGQKDKDN